MMKKGDKFILKADKLITGGDALGRAEGFPVFFAGGCPGDEAEVSIVKVNKTYARGVLTEIKKPSPFRVKPFCPLHNVCGGCGLQHIDYEEQIRQKQLIVKETINKISGEDIEILPVIASPREKEYRHKIQIPVSQTKISKRLIAGYYKQGTHDNINIKYCPVQPAVIDELIELIRKEAFTLNISGYDEFRHSGLLRHILFRISHSDGKVLVTFVLNSGKIGKQIEKLADIVFNHPFVTGVCVNYNEKQTNVITGDTTIVLKGEPFITEKINNIEYEIGAEAFFQVNPAAAEIIFTKAREIVEEYTENPVILDAYSGVGAFGLQMKDIAKEIICVEENTACSEDAEFNAERNGALNLMTINEDASKAFEKLLSDGKLFDVVLLDPPRKGCSVESLRYAVKLCKKIIIYVSCNPSTLASDIKYLHENGFVTRYIQPVDMFPHVPHIECIALIEKKAD